MIIDNKTLQEKIEQVAQGLEKIKPLLTDVDLMTWFAEDFALRFCWSSNAIEGNTLSLDETIALVEYDEVRAGHTYSEYQEAKNLYHAICTSMIPFHSEPITEIWIKTNNGLIRGVEGEYRAGDVQVGTLLETAHFPPHFDRVPELMRDFVKTVNFEAVTIADLFEKLTLSHLTFERIHPFLDGNGRVGRMVLNQQLINHGLLPVALTKTSSYIQAFKHYSRNKDMSLLMYEILKEEEKSIERLAAFEKKREQGLNWDPKMTLEERIEAAGQLQANQTVPARNNREER